MMVFIPLLALVIGAGGPRAVNGRTVSTAQTRPAQVPAAGGTAAPAAWTPYQVEGADHTITLYLAHDRTPKPLVVLIHGSGCAPVMTIDVDGVLRDTSVFQDVV